MLIPTPNPVRLRCWGRQSSRLALLLGLPLALGCGSDHLTPAQPIDPEALFWDLELNHRAVTLSTTAPYDTLTLTATPRNHAGETLAGVPAPRYTTSDDSRVLVTPEGVLVALKSTTPYQPVGVTARLTMDGMTHAATVIVKVVDDPAPPVLASLSIDPVPPDSAKRSIFLHCCSPAPVLKNEDFTLSHLPRVRASDTAGQPVTGFGVLYSSSDSTIGAIPATFSSGAAVAGYTDVVGDELPMEILPLIPGSIEIYASATVFGVTKVDTLPYQIGWPMGFRITVAPIPNLGPGNFFTIGAEATRPVNEIRIGVGGFVTWRTAPSNVDADSPTPFATEVVFDDPTNVRPLEDAAQLMSPDFYPAMCNNQELLAGTFDGCSTGGNFVLPENFRTAVYRVFPLPGTYEYQNALNGARSRVVVMP